MNKKRTAVFARIMAAVLAMVLVFGITGAVAAADGFAIVYGRVQTHVTVDTQPVALGASGESGGATYYRSVTIHVGTTLTVFASAQDIAYNAMACLYVGGELFTRVGVPRYIGEYRTFTFDTPGEYIFRIKSNPDPWTQTTRIEIIFNVVAGAAQPVTPEPTPTPAPTPPPQDALVGQIIQFGGIGWRVLSVQGDRKLIITENLYGTPRVMHSARGEITWEQSNMRAWLNNEFFNSFSAADRARIAETTVINDNVVDSAAMLVYGGNDTVDRIFLLSVGEANRYFANNADRVASGGGESQWWLRSIGWQGRYFAYVTWGGFVQPHGWSASDGAWPRGVRPALWLYLGDVAAPSPTPTPTPTPSPTPSPSPTPPPPEENVTVILDGAIMYFEDVPPRLINGRTMVPLRAIFEAMGAYVDWHNPTQTATATKGDIVVILQVGCYNPTINGVVFPIDQAAEVIDRRTLAPLRFVAEAFGGTVDWHSQTRTATITSPAPGQTPLPTPPAAGVSLSLDRNAVTPGGAIQVTVRGVTQQMLTDNAWVGIYAIGAGHSAWQGWGWVDMDGETITLTAPATPGNYEVRFYAHGGIFDDTTLLARAPFTVQ